MLDIDEDITKIGLKDLLDILFGLGILSVTTSDENSMKISDLRKNINEEIVSRIG